MPPEEQGRAAAFLADIELFRGASDDDVLAVYDRAADRYDRFRELWLRLAGAAAEEAMLADLGAVLRPGAKVLDAGCGTGALARTMLELELEPDIELTLIDLSAAMLARANDLPGEHVQGSVLELPFADGTFDVVVSAWVIETVPDPMRAVREYLRVLSPDGHSSTPSARCPVAGSREPAVAGCGTRWVGASRASSSTASTHRGTTATARISFGSATASRPRWHSASAALLERQSCQAPRGISGSLTRCAFPTIRRNPHRVCVWLRTRVGLLAPNVVGATPERP